MVTNGPEYYQYHGRVVPPASTERFGTAVRELFVRASVKLGAMSPGSPVWHTASVEDLAQVLVGTKANAAVLADVELSLAVKLAAQIAEQEHARRVNAQGTTHPAADAIGASQFEIGRHERAFSRLCACPSCQHTKTFPCAWRVSVTGAFRHKLTGLHLRMARRAELERKQQQREQVLHPTLRLSNRVRTLRNSYSSVRFFF